MQVASRKAAILSEGIASVQRTMVVKHTSALAKTQAPAEAQPFEVQAANVQLKQAWELPVASHLADVLPLLFNILSIALHEVLMHEVEWFPLSGQKSSTYRNSTCWLEG